MTFHAQKQIIRFLKGRNSTSEILDDLRRYRAKLISLCSPKPKPKPETENVKVSFEKAETRCSEGRGPKISVIKVNGLSIS